MMYINIVSISALCIAVAFSGWEGKHSQLTPLVQWTQEDGTAEATILGIAREHLQPPLWTELVDLTEVCYRQLQDLAVISQDFLSHSMTRVAGFIEVWKKDLVNILKIWEQIEKSILVVITHTPIILYYLIKLYIYKVNRISKATAVSVLKPGDQEKEQTLETEAERLQPGIHSLYNCNKQLQFERDQKVREIDAMARTVYQLQRQSQSQERDILQRDKEIEELARTIEYLQRPSSKRWSDVLDRVYKINCSAPQLVSGEYVHLPMVTEIEMESLTAPLGSEGDSDSEGVAEMDPEHPLEWDEWG